MSAELAAEIERLARRVEWWSAPGVQQSAKQALARCVWNNLPAILTALRRTHAEADVERVARAIYDSMFAPHERCWGKDPWLRDRYMDTARAALAALPRPAESDAVERAARTWTTLHGEDWDELGPTWQASRLDLFAKVLRAAALPRPEADEGARVQKCAVSGYPAGHPDACNDCDPCIHWRLRWTDGCPWRSECARVCPCHMMEQEMPAIDGADDHEPFDPNNPKLKPCPFCGGEPHLEQCEDQASDNFGGYYVECSSCTASSPLRFSAGDDARPLVCEQWNSRRDRPRPEADEGVVDAYDIPDQLERLADYLAPLHGAWVARTAARELRDGRSRYRAVASALCRERGLVPDELISDAGHEVWELVGHEAVQKESAALAAAQEGVK